jgi:hypothetical protein
MLNTDYQKKYLKYKLKYNILNRVEKIKEQEIKKNNYGGGPTQSLDLRPTKIDLRPKKIVLETLESALKINEERKGKIMSQIEDIKKKEELLDAQFAIDIFKDITPEEKIVIDNIKKKKLTKIREPFEKLNKELYLINGDITRLKYKMEIIKQDEDYDKKVEEELKSKESKEPQRPNNMIIINRNK